MLNELWGICILNQLEQAAIARADLPDVGENLDVFRMYLCIAVSLPRVDTAAPGPVAFLQTRYVY
jgi:hypothetical protein